QLLIASSNTQQRFRPLRLLRLLPRIPAVSGVRPVQCPESRFPSRSSRVIACSMPESGLQGPLMYLIEPSYYGNLGDNAPAGQASMHAMHRMHSESLNFFQSRSRIGICIGQAVSHSLHSEHLIGSRCIPRRLFFWVTAMIAPTGHT